jgi:beta-glucosidase
MLLEARRIIRLPADAEIPMDRSNRKPPVSPRVADANRIAGTIAGSNLDPATESEAQEIAMPRSIDIATVGRREFLALGAATAAGTIALPALAQGRDFGSGFVWGAATSAYQIEGSPTHAGGGASVWDTFCRRPGAIRDGSSGDVACDHINRWREDLALIRELGVRAYRFSISWPRVLPDGTGTVSAAGLDFYDRLVDALLAAGIEPWVTLFHWDYPEALHRRGGWLKEDSPDWFAKYATTVVKRLSDRVRHWMTFNEPEIFIILGYQLALHAPGDKLSWSDILRISHRVLLAHGLATQSMRATSKQPCQIGCAAALQPVMPATDQPADLDAARRATFSGMAAWLLEPMYRGAYPDSELKAWEKDVPKFPMSDLRTIAQPLDFFAANVYQAAMVRAGVDGKVEQVARPWGFPRRLMDVFDVVPGGLYWGPRFYYERYKLPIVITENGTSVPDWIALDGKVHDPQRIDFMQRYLRELARARGEGADVRGYFAWSLMDNFEWAEGYRQRFGLIHVDFATQRRTRKDSFGWYREVIRSNGASL